MADIDIGNLTRTDLFREIALLLWSWIYWLPLVVVLLGAAGRLGRGVGFHNLFRDDDQLFDPERAWGSTAAEKPRPPGWDWAPHWLWRLGASPAFWSGFGFLAAFGLFWIAVHGGRDPFCYAGAARVRCPTQLFGARGAGSGFLLLALGGAAAAFLGASWVAAGRARADFTERPRARVLQETARVAAGLALGAVFALVAHAMGDLAAAGRRPPGAASVVAPRIAMWMAALPYIALVVFAAMRRSVLPCMSIAALIIGLILLGALLAPGDPAWTPAWALAAGGLIWWANSRADKYELPGFGHLYGGEMRNPQARAAPERRSTLVPPVAALEAWRARRGEEKPFLVLLATSGGAYRATFWTSLLMDRLVAGSGPDGPWPGLAGDVRLVTGASGGMVAGAYLVAMAAGGTLEEGISRRIAADTRARMGAADGEGRNQPIARDSLSPVVHQMVSRDLPALVIPRPAASDRGRALDAQWPTLARSFAEVAASERDGVAPSIILSPMLVETGAVALFSNLDLLAMRKRGLPEGASDAAVDKASVEIFRAFAGTQEAVSLATAVRLNATFPYVSPAISLPTRPERRPVDAGYYDNYGIDLLTAYLDQEGVRAFAREHCAGIAVIQVRAFPSSAPTPPASGLGRALQFLTSPVEALFNARQSSQMFRNDQQLAQTRRRYAEEVRPGFLRVFTFEANTDVSMSWYLRCDEMRALEGLVRPPLAADLYWRDRLGPGEIPPSPLGSPVASRAEVEAWQKTRFDMGGEDQRGAGLPSFVAALQSRDPEALRSQFLHHRAKIADEFAALEAFWRGPDQSGASPQRRTSPDTPSKAPGTSARASSRSGLVGGGKSSGRARSREKPKRP